MKFAFKYPNHSSFMGGHDKFLFLFVFESEIFR